MTNDIQKARDVLANWREAQNAKPWQMTTDWTGDAAELSTPDENPLGWMNHPADARLIVGTAGNPELLDAIDGMLSFAQAAVVGSTDRYFGSMVNQAYVIAAAIIAAEGRMSA